MNNVHVGNSVDIKIHHSVAVLLVHIMPVVLCVYLCITIVSALVNSYPMHLPP